MFLSNASIRRPVAIGCVIIALSLLGLNAYRKMGLELMPKVELPYLTIITVYPGASPSEIETDIAKKIEDAVASVEGIKHITSNCMEDSCFTFLEFELQVDVDVAANDVREKLDFILNDLPADAEKPKILKFDINAIPIIHVALTGDVSVEELYDFADNELRDRLTALPGVAEVQLIGGAEREVNVLLDRETLASRGLSSIDVVRAVQEGIMTIPSGRVRQQGTEYNVKFDAEYDTVSSIGALEVANENNSRWYVSDLGQVVMTTAEQRQVSFIDGRPCIAMRIVKRADANAVQTVDRVRKEMARIRQLLPGGMELVWVSDNAEFIRATLDDTTTNIWQGVLLTAAILFLFLYNVRSTLIVAITMPLTIIIGFAFIRFMDYTLNVATLLSIGLSVGVLVTNSIVVLESIVKRSWTLGIKEAAGVGAGEVAVAVLGSAGTNIVVLFPVAMMASRVALFFRPFAITMVVVTAVSLFISFTLTPVLCSVLLRRQRDAASRSLLARMEALWNRGFNVVAEKYADLLRFFARRRWAAVVLLVGSVAVFVQALSLAPKLGFDFFEDADQGEVFVKLEYPTRYSLPETERRVQEVEHLLRDVPGLLHAFTTIGKVEGVMGQASEGVYLAQILLKFVDKTKRTESMEDLLNVVRARLERYPDCIATVSVGEIIGGQSHPIELEMAGEKLAVLDALAERVVAFSEKISGIADPNSSVRAGKPEIRIRPRRALLSDLNLPPAAMGLALRANLEGIKAGVFKQGSRTYDIRVKLAEEAGKQQVPQFLFPGAPGHPLVLSNLADTEETLAPVQITRSDKRRISKVFAQLHEGKPLGAAVNELSRAIDEQGQLPPGYSYRFSGLYEVMQEGVNEFLEAGILAVLLTYLLLAAILESFRQPFVILVTVPLGLVGMVWSLYITGRSISMFVLLGGVMLIGIVVNNAILIMDQLNQLVAAGVPRHEAMARAAGTELRPVLMITLAAVLGMLPMALSGSLGSEMRNGIGIASIGGLTVSALLSLIVMPVLYDLFTRDTDKHS